jgi:putative transposase
MYLVIVLGVFSRRIDGWAIENYLRTEQVLSAIERAFAQRCPQDAIHHSDHGCQYTSIAFGKLCEQLGVCPSIGDCFDNAMTESFFASLECELLGRCHCRTHAEAKTAVFK